MKRELSAEGRLAWLIVLATMPSRISGVLCFGDYIEEQLRSTQVIATTTIVFALCYWLPIDTASEREALPSIGWKDARLIGLLVRRWLWCRELLAQESR